MDFFYNLNTRAKLLLSFFIVIVLNAVILTTSINSMIYARNVALLLNEVLVNSFQRISRVQNAASDINLSFIRGLNTTDTAYTSRHIQRDAPAMIQELSASISVLNPRHFNRQEYIDGNATLQKNVRAAIDVIQNEVMPLINKGEDKASLDYYLRHAAPLFAEISSNTLTLIKIQHEECTKLSIPAADPTVIYVNSALGLACTVIAIFLALFISNYISRAVKDHIVILKQMANGDLSVKFNDTNKDEFGQSHQALNQLRNSLNEIIVNTKMECSKLQKEMRSLQSLSSSIVDNSGNVETQAVTVSAASDEMVSTTQDIARNCETAAHSSDICKDISDNGLNQVLTAVNSIRQQAEHTKDNAQKIESLAQQTKEIGSIVSTIDDIAAQTNLLALNAAIEAARAGEAGRGFAVVADEVRALASRTSSSTQEISKMVKNIQDEAALATESINASVENMDAVAEQASATETLLQDITHHVLEVNKQITQIATAAEEQTTATSEISVNMQHITQSTTTMTENANVQNSTMDTAYNDLEKLIQALSFFKTIEKKQPTA